jgi:hypothetical protein
MKVRLAGGALLVGCLALLAHAQDTIKSGPDKKIGGAFQVKAITGGSAGTQLCYV